MGEDDDVPDSGRAAGTDGVPTYMRMISSLGDKMQAEFDPLTGKVRTEPAKRASAAPPLSDSPSYGTW